MDYIRSSVDHQATCIPIGQPRSVIGTNSEGKVGAIFGKLVSHRKIA